MIKKQESNLRKAVNELLGYSSDFEDEIDVADIKEEPRVDTKEIQNKEEPNPASGQTPPATGSMSNNPVYGTAINPAPGTIMNQAVNPMSNQAQNPMMNSAPGSALNQMPQQMANQMNNQMANPTYGSGINPAPNPMRMTAETSKVSSYTVETKTLSMEPTNQSSLKVAVITEDMIVNGDISTQSDLNIYGFVTGSIVSRGDVLVMGRVTGDVSGVNVRVEGEVNGNLTVDKRADVGANGRIKGDITATNVSSEGISEGDIKAEETIHLGGNSIVTGKIYAKAFAIIQGAKIKGMMTTYD